MNAHTEAALQAAVTKAVMLQEQLDAAQAAARRERQDKIDAYKIVNVLVERAGGEVTISATDLLDAEKLVLTSWKAPIGVEVKDVRLCLSTRQGMAVEP